MYVRGVDMASVYDFSILFLNCPDNVVFFIFSLITVLQLAVIVTALHSWRCVTIKRGHIILLVMLDVLIPHQMYVLHGIIQCSLHRHRYISFECRSV